MDENLQANHPDAAAEPRHRSLRLDRLSDELARDYRAYAGLQLLARPVDAAISSILGFLGELQAADRCWMFEYNDDINRFRNTHEWSARGVTSHLHDLQDTPTTMIGWLQLSLLKGRAVMINEVEALPPAARLLRQEMLRQGDKSVLCVPVFHAGKLRACIGYDAVRKARIWTDDEAAQLDICGRMIAQARYGGSSARRSATPDEMNAPLIYLGKGGNVRRGAPLAAIMGVRSYGNDTVVWLTDGSIELDSRKLHRWRDMLPLAKFPSIHRTAIVNIAHIAGLNKHGGQSGFHWELSIRGLEEPWPVSRQYRRDLVHRMGW